MFRQPDSIRRKVKNKAVSIHLPGRDRQYDRPAVTPSDCRRHGGVRRQMNVMALTFDQPLLFDRSQKSFGRSMVKNFRGDGGGVSQFVLDRRNLSGPDPKA